MDGTCFDPRNLKMFIYISDLFFSFLFIIVKVGPLAAHYQVPLRHILLVCILIPSCRVTKLIKDFTWQLIWISITLYVILTCPCRFMMIWAYQMVLWGFNHKEDMAITTGMFVWISLVTELLCFLEYCFLGR